MRLPSQFVRSRGTVCRQFWSIQSGAEVVRSQEQTQTHVEVGLGGFSSLGDGLHATAFVICENREIVRFG